MNKELNDKFILITGASSGIGKGIAKTLCRNGYNLILTSRSSKKLNQLEDELSDYSEKIHLIACDLTNSDDIENLYEDELTNDERIGLGFLGMHEKFDFRESIENES